MRGPDVTPFDQAWSALAAALFGAAIAIHVFLITGAFAVFTNATEDALDSRVVGVAHYGALALLGGLALLGLIAVAARRAPDGPKVLPWPRFRPIEDKDGRRVPVLAWVSLLSVTLVPLFVAIVCLVRYIKKSRIADWDGFALGGEGFLRTRWSALTQGCPEHPCFRMLPDTNAPEWLPAGDIGLLVFGLSAVGMWIWFILLARQRWVFEPVD